MRREQISIRGAREHNLRIDALDIPKRRLVVFTGVPVAVLQPPDPVPRRDDTPSRARYAPKTSRTAHRNL